MRQIQAPPSQLVVDGRLQFGTYDAPFETTNALDAAILPLLPVPRALKALRLKEWQAFQFGNERVFGMVALFNAKVLALVQLKLYDRRKRRKLLFEKKVAPWSFTLPTTLLRSETSYRSRRCWVRIRNRLREGRIEIDFDVARGLRRPRIHGELTALAEGCQPMVVCQPFSARRGMYSHKGLMPAVGQLRIGREKIGFSPEHSHALMDDHKGYYPYVMKWDWVTAAGRDDRGRLIGFNLTRNQCVDPERYNENGFWLDGKLHLLPPVKVVREHGAGGGEQWTIRDRDGTVDLRFHVEVPGRVDVNAGIVRSKYRGPFGSFEGRLEDGQGQSLRVDGLFGMGEDFYLRC